MKKFVVYLFIGLLIACMGITILGFLINSLSSTTSAVATPNVSAIYTAAVQTVLAKQPSPVPFFTMIPVVATQAPAFIPRTCLTGQEYANQVHLIMGEWSPVMKSQSELFQNADIVDPFWDSQVRSNLDTEDQIALRVEALKPPNGFYDADRYLKIAANESLLMNSDLRVGLDNVSAASLQKALDHQNSMTSALDTSLALVSSYTPDDTCP